MVDQFSTTETDLPELLTFFMMGLFKKERRNPSRSENIGRLIRSYSADLVHGVSRGNTVSAKNFLLALGVHYITGLHLFLKCLEYSRNTVSFNNRAEAV